MYDRKDEYEYQFDPCKHLTFITNILNGVVGEKIKTIKSRSAKDAVTKILEDYFDLDFKITYKNDPFGQDVSRQEGACVTPVTY